MYALLKVSNALATFTSLIGKIAAWLAVPMMLVILLDVVMRKAVEAYPNLIDSFLFTDIGSNKLQELEWHLHAALFLLCLGFAYIKNAHVRVELVRENFASRTKAWLELLGVMVFLIPYCFVVIKYGSVFAQRSFAMNEVSSALTGLPYRWIIKSMLPLGFAILGLAGISVALRSVIYLFGPPELRQETATYVEADEISELRSLAEQELEQDRLRHPEHKSELG